mgnify:CR=1 FL=1
MPISNNITMRIDAVALKRIDQAARMSGKNRTQFMVDAALRNADSLLPDPDRLRIELEVTAFQAVLDLLGQPTDKQGLARLLDKKDLPWNSP